MKFHGGRINPSPQEKELKGNTFGNYDNFHGLGIVFDTYDNDGKVTRKISRFFPSNKNKCCILQRDNPSINALLFDGDDKYDEKTDGEQTRCRTFCFLSPKIIPLLPVWMVDFAG